MSLRQQLFYAIPCMAFLVSPLAAANDITIQAGSVSPIASSPVTSNTLGAADIQNFLENTGSLVITTDLGSGGVGNITIAAGVNISWSSGNNLTLFANNRLSAGSGTLLQSQNSKITLIITELDLPVLSAGVISAGNGIDILPSTQGASLALGDTSSASISIGSAELAALNPGSRPFVLGNSSSPLGIVNLDSLDLSGFTGGLSLYATSVTGGNIEVPGLKITTTTGNITLGDLTTRGIGLDLLSNGGPISIGEILADGNSGSPVMISGSSSLTTGNIDTSGSVGNGGNVTLDFAGSVETGNVNTSGTQGGNVFFNSLNRITAGTIDSSGTVGNGGNVTLDPPGDVEVVSIDARGGALGTGGTVLVQTGSDFRATGTVDGTSSILASGGTGPGSITLEYGTLNPSILQIGNATLHGTAGSVADGVTTLTAGQTFISSFTSGQIALNTDGIILTESAGSTSAVEGGGDDSFTLQLEEDPAGQADILVSGGTQLLVSSNNVTFGPSATLNLTSVAPATIYVRAVNDGTGEGNHSGDITFTVSGTSTQYNGFPLPNLNVSLSEAPSTVKEWEALN